MNFFVFKNFQDFSGKFQLQLLSTVAERQNLNPRIIFAAFGDIYTDFDDTEQKVISLQLIIYDRKTEKSEMTSKNIKNSVTGSNWNLRISRD